MDLRLTDDQAALREQAADFSRGLRPLLEADPEWRRQGLLSDGDSRPVTEALGRAGWIGVPWPAELGGRGLGHLDAALAEEIFGYHWLPLSLYLLSAKTIGAALAHHGSTELQQRLLPSIARGELVFSQGFSEPGAGSDLASLRTRAVVEDDHFVVDGHKIWTSSAHLADWIYLAVRTDPDRPKHGGISVLVADLATPGITVRQFPTLGEGRSARCSSTTSRFRARTSSASSTKAGRCSCTRSTSSASRRRSSAAWPGSSTRSSAVSARPDAFDPPRSSWRDFEASSRPHGSCLSALPGFSTGTSRPRPRRPWRSSPAHA